MVLSVDLDEELVRPFCGLQAQCENPLSFVSANKRRRSMCLLHPEDEDSCAKQKTDFPSRAISSTRDQ